MTSQLGTQCKGTILLFTLTAREVKWRGKINLKTEEESYLTVLCCRRPNKVSCKNHSSTPDISMQTFLNEAKRKQKWMTFARIHRLPCQWNNLPCAPSILKHYVSEEVCLLGHQWNSRGFTLTRYLEKGSVPSIYEKPKDSSDTDYPRNERRLANRFFPRNVLWMFLGDPTVKRQYSKSPPPPPKKNRFLFGLGRPIRNMLSIFQDDRSTTLCNRMGLF